MSKAFPIARTGGLHQQCSCTARPAASDDISKAMMATISFIV
jgi:hypothetical protein